MGKSNIPNAGRPTVRAYMRTQSFVSAENPTPELMKKHDEEINKFLETIDNTKRMLNGRNCYAIGNKIYTLIWYLDVIPDEPVTVPFGGPPKNEQTNPTEKTENK